MKWLLGTYTQGFNRRHRLSGHLFQGRYKAQHIDGRSPDYLRAACGYVHLNPVRAGLVKEGEKLESYEWSSLLGVSRSKGDSTREKHGYVRLRNGWSKIDNLRLAGKNYRVNHEGGDGNDLTRAAARWPLPRTREADRFDNLV